VGLIQRLKAMRPAPAGPSRAPLPDPAKPPGNRGEWDEAALTNVEITELVKRQIRTTTLPWQK
jgi:hypothetical protein